MLFNSLHFLVFFVIVTLAYFSLRWPGRWKLLLLASCYFYMVFVPKYLLILFGTIVIDYFAGLWIEKSSGLQRKLLLIVSLIANIGILAVFKYYDFTAENLERLLGTLGAARHVPRLLEALPDALLPGQRSTLVSHLLLPIGLSFHTFQAMSYTIEVFRGNQRAERHFGIYALYVMFYPQLVAGPIERPQNVLWQYHTYFPYNWENVKAGLMRMAWGFFKKVVIADRLAMVVDPAYADVSGHNGLSLLVATFCYTIQIYCDFSAYSDIAIGAARVMGYDLMENFRTPYVATSITDFWRRWHISLSTWFRDYFYIPLGGNRKGEVRRYVNLFLTFLVSGIWHGANWTFVIWGALHGLYQTAENFYRQHFPPVQLGPPLLDKWLKRVLTFLLVMLTWVFFRATTLRDAYTILAKIFNPVFWGPLQMPLNAAELALGLAMVGFMFWKEARYFVIPTDRDGVFWPLWTVLLAACYFLGVFSSSQFIYFQF